MIIAIDFDGTCVTHKYPEIGEDIGAAPVLRALVKSGNRLILNTMRSHRDYLGRDLLQEAVDWFKKNDIELYGVNGNPDQKDWTDSPKVYANMYIDDAALGCPKKQTPNGEIVVNWPEIGNWLMKVGLIETF